MGGGHNKPRSGSLAFYPRKRVAKELATFRTVGLIEKARPRALNFVGYKVGMVHAMARNLQEKTTSFGQQVIVPITVIECPPLSVFGVRAYVKEQGALKVLGEATVEKLDKHFRKRMTSFKKGGSKKKGEKSYLSLDGLQKLSNNIVQVRLLCGTRPSELGFGKKVPDIFEVFVGGTVLEQFAFAMEKFGKEVSVDEVFSEKQFVDVKATDTGKGFSGVIKRFGVKMQRRKAKKRRIVGSIGPWNPSTVMRTVARAGQLGYQARTELNKRVLKISSNPAEINIPGGFEGYGNVKTKYVLLSGSIPGPVKRAIALRVPVRKAYSGSFNVTDISIVGMKKQGKKTDAADDEVKAQKVIVKKEEKKEHKSVEEEIMAAAGGHGAKK